ncbi:hypothetical protein SDC9_165729 [bioreactor metagenome]|uniref:Uncharacterized protein n=1 Tax=bioreactor metagenome TaxID=1076179 RepID=A0A645FXL2_9ZZZZ
MRGGQHADQAAVFGHQHIAAAHGLAAWQKDGQLATLAVGGGKAALLTQIPVQFHGRGAFEDDGGKALTLEQQFVGSQHGEFTMK